MYYLIAAFVGISIGSIIAFFITKFKSGIFDLSLCMNTLIYGFTTFFVGSLANFALPEGMVDRNKKYAIVIQTATVGETGWHMSFIIILSFGILLHLFLRYTTIGRGIFAVGSIKAVVIRTGFNINRIPFFVFHIMGIASGIAEVTLSVFLGYFSPVLLMGKILQVLAGFVLGGASIQGGRGSVLSTFMCVLLVGLDNQALVYLGISPQWFDALIGIIFITYATFLVISSNVAAK